MNKIQTTSFRVLLALIVAVMLAAAPAQAMEKIRFGVLPVVDTLPLLVGQDREFFPAEGIALEIIPFQSALERDAALQAGQIDGYFGDILNTMLLIHAGQNIRIISTVFHTHPAHRMFGIAAAPGSGISDAADLQGRSVAISRATVIEYLLDRMIESRRLDAGRVGKQEIKKIPIRLQMLLSGQIDAALLPEPLLTLAEIKGGTVVLDDRGLDTSLTVLAMNMSRVTGHPDLVARFLRAYAKAVKAINENPFAYKETLVTRTQFPAPAKDAYQVPVFPEAGPPSREDVAAVAQWMAERGMGDRRLPYEQVVFIANP